MHAKVILSCRSGEPRVLPARLPVSQVLLEKRQRQVHASLDVPGDGCISLCIAPRHETVLHIYRVVPKSVRGCIDERGEGIECPGVPRVATMSDVISGRQQSSAAVWCVPAK